MTVAELITILAEYPDITDPIEIAVVLSGQQYVGYALTSVIPANTEKGPRCLFGVEDV